MTYIPMAEALQAVHSTCVSAYKCLKLLSCTLIYHRLSYRFIWGNEKQKEEKIIIRHDYYQLLFKILEHSVKNYFSPLFFKFLTRVIQNE